MELILFSMKHHNPLNFSRDFADKGYLDRENDILERQVLSKNHSYTVETGVLNIPNPIRMTSSPPRLQLQTSGKRGGGS